MAAIQVDSQPNKRRIIVTGAAHGIGAAIAARFVSDGASVVLIDRDRNAVEQRAAALTESGPGEAIAVTADLASEPERVDAIQFASEGGGRAIDLLVNNAATAAEGGVDTVSPADFRRVLEVNLVAPMHLSQLVVPLMQRDRQPAIVHIASVQGLQAEQGNAAYCASKGGLITLTKSMALDLAPKGIRVNAVAPGAIRSKSLADGLAAMPDPAAAEQDWSDLAAQRRIGTPEEVAAAVHFLAGPDAGFCTGSILTVDGGLMASFMMAGRPV